MPEQNKAIIIGVSEYPNRYPRLPAVASDVREVAKLLSSAEGAFDQSSVRTLLDAQATRSNIRTALNDVLGSTRRDDTIFVYISGDGSADAAGNCCFVSHDAEVGALEKTAVSLTYLKRLFDDCRSERVFLWLDFCHSGGILSRSIHPQNDSDDAALARALGVVRGHGKVIMCSCAANQLAYEDAGHGHFTKYLLKGLSGEAANRYGEVTASSLHDYIDHAMGSARQRPILMGTFTGRIVLMHARQLPHTSEGGGSSGPSLAVEDSGPWIMLGDTFFKTSKVRYLDGSVVQLEIPSEGARDDARVRAFSPESGWQAKSVPFAHRSNAMIVRVKSSSGESTGGGQVWTLKLETETTTFGNGFMSDIAVSTGKRNYSADEIAELRARRILLDDPPAVDRGRGRQTGLGDSVEMFVEGMNTSYAVKNCILKALYPEYKDRHFLEIARLAAVYALKASNTFAEILELKLGPIIEGAMEVFCVGRRHQIYSNKPATEFAISGRCLLH